MAFRVGQKVVCVCSASRPGKRWAPGEQPEVGREYIVCATGITDDALPGVKLAELPRTSPKFKWFRADRFRPLVEKKTETGMAVLLEILDRESVDERKPARVR